MGREGPNTEGVPGRGGSRLGSSPGTPRRPSSQLSRNSQSPAAAGSRATPRSSPEVYKPVQPSTGISRSGRPVKLPAKLLDFVCAMALCPSDLRCTLDLRNAEGRRCSLPKDPRKARRELQRLVYSGRLVSCALGEPGSGSPPPCLVRELLRLAHSRAEYSAADRTFFFRPRGRGLSQEGAVRSRVFTASRMLGGASSGQGREDQSATSSHQLSSRRQAATTPGLLLRGPHEVSTSGPSSQELSCVQHRSGSGKQEPEETLAGQKRRNTGQLQRQQFDRRRRQQAGVAEGRQAPPRSSSKTAGAAEIRTGHAVLPCSTSAGPPFPCKDQGPSDRRVGSSFQELPRKDVCPSDRRVGSTLVALPCKDQGPSDRRVGSSLPELCRGLGPSDRRVGSSAPELFPCKDVCPSDRRVGSPGLPRKDQGPSGRRAGSSVSELFPCKDQGPSDRRVGSSLPELSKDLGPSDRRVGSSLPELRQYYSGLDVEGGETDDELEAVWESVREIVFRPVSPLQEEEIEWKLHPIEIVYRGRHRSGTPIPHEAALWAE